MKLRIVCSLPVLLLIASAAFSQSIVSSSTTNTAGRVTGTATFQPGPLPMTAVVGAPYSGEETQETVQTLLDGTHISRSRGVIKTYRDSQGRIRTERPLFMGPVMGPGPNAQESPVIIEISDPVAGVRFTLDTQNKVAHRTAVPAAGGPRVFRSGGMSAVVAANGATTATFSPSLPGAVPIPPPVRLGAPARVNRDDPMRPQFASERLGTDVMEGVLVEGTRQTTTYPVGSQGNDRPIVVTTDIWQSPDLKITILNKSTDPRSGENTIRITNLNRAEPDPSLFQPPPEYSVVEETGPYTVQFSR